MSTYKQYLRERLVSKQTKSNFNDELCPDACLELPYPKLTGGNILSIDYDTAKTVLPKIIIQAYFNKFGKKPLKQDLIKLLAEIKETMEGAMDEL